jgi:hypothetical protein
MKFWEAMKAAQEDGHSVCRKRKNGDIVSVSFKSGRPGGFIGCTINTFGSHSWGIYETLHEDMIADDWEVPIQYRVKWKKQNRRAKCIFMTL